MGIDGIQTQRVPGADSAVGILPSPPPTSHCASLGLGMIQLVSAKNFNLQCGQIFAGNDIEQQFQPSFHDCLHACANAAGCGGISFDIQQSQGFKNCYLKTMVTTGGLLARSGVDSAFVAVDHSAAAPYTSISSFTPLPTTSPVPLDSLLPSGSSSLASAEPLPTPSDPVPLAEATMTISSPLSEVTDSQALQEAAPSSNAWIAAPVVGIAAVALLLGVFALWGRKGRVRGLPFTFLERWLDRRQPRWTMSSSRGNRLSDEEPVRADSAMSGGWRNSILVTKVISNNSDTLSRTDLRIGGGDLMTDIEIELEKGVDWKKGSALRDSQNGLKLNGVSIPSTAEEKVPGIPLEFAGPEYQSAVEEDTRKPTDDR